MGVFSPEDHRSLAIAAGGRIQAREVLDLRTIPWGYYLKRNGLIGVLQADHLFRDYYKKAKGHEFLCLKSEYPLETVEACVYLRELALLEPTVDIKPIVPHKRNKRKIKKGGK